MRTPHVSASEQHALANFLELETEDGVKGHALSTYPMKYGISEFINGEVAPVLLGMDAGRPEQIRTRVFWATARKYYMGAWNCAMSLIDVALWDGIHYLWDAKPFRGGCASSRLDQ